MTYFKEKKEGNIIGSNLDADHLSVIEEGMHETLLTIKTQNRETTPFCYQLTTVLATTLSPRWRTQKIHS